MEIAWDWTLGAWGCSKEVVGGARKYSVYCRCQVRRKGSSCSKTLTPWGLSVQFSSVAQLFPTLCDPMNHSTPGLPVHHQLPESTQSRVHRVGDAIQPPHLLLSPSPPALNVSQHQGLFQWVSSSHQVAKVLEFHLQYQSFQRTPRTVFSVLKQKKRECKRTNQG